MKKYYVTTPIYYVNDRPHIGHAYTTVVADALARYHRLRGERTFFSVGVDENSQKNLEAMKKAGETNLKHYLDSMAAEWKGTWEELSISFDDFIRTTEERHLAGVRRFWEAVAKSGDIYEGEYVGRYCVGCESFKTETELVDDHCSLHPNKDLEAVKERNYFFRASAYREALLAHLDAHPEFVQPESRRNEIRRYIADHLSDFSISREAKYVNVGIPVPGDESQRIYVWFDALLNYLTVIGYGADDEKCAAIWPADLHLVGKDIIKFHCALWPAMIMSAAKNDALLRDEAGAPKLPRQVFAHGFFTLDGQKISKSLGNAVDPREFVPVYGMDALRYFLLREIPFGEDGDFSRTRLQERYVHDLANTLGNLVNRAVAMSRKYFDGCVPSPEDGRGQVFAGAEGSAVLRRVVDEHVASNRLDLALEAIWNGVDGAQGRSTGSRPELVEGLIQANKFIEDTQPFKLVKTDPQAVAAILYSLLEYCRIVAWHIEPAMPGVARRILEQLGQDPSKERERGIESLLAWGGLQAGTTLPEPKILFPPSA